MPALLTDGGELLTQSLAIIEYLDELHPEPPLLPPTPEARAFSRAVALAVAAEIHALLPPRVAAYLGTPLGLDEAGIAAWRRHWVGEGLAAVEALISGRGAGTFVVGDRPSLADIFLFPQAIGAERTGFDFAQWPSIAGIISKLRAIPAFADNAPAARR